MPGARVWARYLPGTDLVVGGDFWDVIELPMQRLLLVVGDVAGRGEPAAIVMGRLRTVIRAVADTDVTPASLIAALNRFLVDHEDEMATCLCAVLDQTTGTVRVANAGHPPLLLPRRRRLGRLLRRRDRRAAGRSPVHDAMARNGSQWRPATRSSCSPMV